jgi:hypothetical protein
MKDLFLGFDFLGEIFVILWEERFYVIWCRKIDGYASLNLIGFAKSNFRSALC